MAGEEARFQPMQVVQPHAIAGNLPAPLPLAPGALEMTPGQALGRGLQQGLANAADIQKMRGESQSLGLGASQIQWIKDHPSARWLVGVDASGHAIVKPGAELPAGIPATSLFSDMGGVKLKDTDGTTQDATDDGSKKEPAPAPPPADTGKPAPPAPADPMTPSPTGEQIPMPDRHTTASPNQVPGNQQVPSFDPNFDANDPQKVQNFRRANGLGGPGISEALPATTPPDQPQMSLSAASPLNQHPIMSAGTALGIAKNWDSSVKRATYIHGNGQEPSYAFYDGKNTPMGPPVPVSVLAKNGGAGQMVGENLGLSMGSAGQPAQPQGFNLASGAGAQQPGVVPQQPGAAQPQPGMNLASGYGGAQGQPAAMPQVAPPAPDFSAQLAQYRVPSMGGSTAGLTAQLSPGQPVHESDGTGGVAGAGFGGDDDRGTGDGFQKFFGIPSAQIAESYKRMSQQQIDSLPTDAFGSKQFMEVKIGTAEDGTPRYAKFMMGPGGHMYSDLYGGPWQVYRVFGDGTNAQLITLPDDVIKRNAGEYLGVGPKQIEQMLDYQRSKGRNPMQWLTSVIEDKWNKENTTPMSDKLGNRVMQLYRIYQYYQRLDDAANHLRQPMDYNGFSQNRNRFAESSWPDIWGGLGDVFDRATGNKSEEELRAQQVKRSQDARAHFKPPDPVVRQMMEDESGLKKATGSADFEGAFSTPELARIRGDIPDMERDNQDYASAIHRKRIETLVDILRLQRSAQANRERIPQWMLSEGANLESTGRISDPSALWNPGDPVPPIPAQNRASDSARVTMPPAGDSGNPRRPRNQDQYDYDVDQGEWMEWPPGSGNIVQKKEPRARFRAGVRP